MSDENILIFEWLNKEIISKADPDEIETLILELNYLLDIMPSSLYEFECEKIALRYWLNNYSSKYHNNDVNNDNESSFLNDISDRPLIAFLKKRSDTNKINLIRSVYFFVCLKLVLLKNYKSRIKRTLDICRYLTLSKRSFLLQFLPDINNVSSLVEILNYYEIQTEEGLYQKWKQAEPNSLDNFITKVRNKPHKEEKNQEWTDEALCNHRLAKHLYDFKFPLEVIIKQKTGIIRRTKETDKVVTSSFYKDETTGNNIDALSFVTEVDDESSGFEVNERQDNEAKAIIQVSFSKPTNYYKDKVIADQQANSRRLRSMSQVTDVNVAHIDEVLILVEKVILVLSELNIEQIIINYNSNDNKNIYYTAEHQSALYLLMLLLSGRKDIALSSSLKQAHHVFTYRVLFKPTRSEIRPDWNEDICARNQEYLLGFLPEPIGYIYASVMATINDKDIINIHENADAILKGLNKLYKTRLTLNKIQNFLGHFLAMQGCDQALIDVLTNKPVHQLSSLPYFNVSQLDLYTCQADFNEYLSDNYLKSEQTGLNELEFKKFLNLPEDKEIGFWDKQTGTALAVSNDKLSTVVKNLISNVNQAFSLKDLNQIDTIVNLHNSFTDYLYLMLALSTGYRPVTEPFGRLEDIDVRTGKYFISDKENHKSSTGRFVYLPDIVSQQILSFTNYLKYLTSIFGRLDYEMATIFADILNSNSGLITYLNFDKNKNVISKDIINTPYIHTRLAKFINLPLNWPRHFIRSYKDIYDGIYSMKDNKRDNRFGYDTIGSFMGHADELGYDFLNRFSGSKSKELRRFSIALNDILLLSGFEVIDLRGAK